MQPSGGAWSGCCGGKEMKQKITLSSVSNSLQKEMPLVWKHQDIFTSVIFTHPQNRKRN